MAAHQTFRPIDIDELMTIYITTIDWSVPALASAIPEISKFRFPTPCSGRSLLVDVVHVIYFSLRLHIGQCIPGTISCTCSVSDRETGAASNKMFGNVYDAAKALMI